MKNLFSQKNMFWGAGGAVVAGAIVFMWSANNEMALTYIANEYRGNIKASTAEVTTVATTAVLPPPAAHIPTPEAVRAVYMTSWVAGTPSIRKPLLEFIRTSKVNAIVIDVKDYSGKISFHTGDPLIEKMGSEEARVPDMRSLIDELHEAHIYTIARISVFQDPYVAAHMPEIAVRTKEGAVWKDRKGVTWVDPASPEMWEYMVRVARAAETVGFDELNFDYVRFPSDGNMSNISFPVWDEIVPRSDVLENFFAYLDTELADLPVPISLDLFGMTMTNTDDLHIGQVLEKAATHADYIAPMVYPSHYPNGWNNLSNPAEHPYEVIHYAMSEGQRRLQAMRALTASTTSPLYGARIAELRPWIQDFDLGAEYTADMIRKQQQAVYDAGLDSWMAWDPKNIYIKEAYR